MPMQWHVDMIQHGPRTGLKIRRGIKRWELPRDKHRDHTSATRIHTPTAPRRTEILEVRGRVTGEQNPLAESSTSIRNATNAHLPGKVWLWLNRKSVPNNPQCQSHILARCCSLPEMEIRRLPCPCNGTLT